MHLHAAVGGFKAVVACRQAEEVFPEACLEEGDVGIVFGTKRGRNLLARDSHLAFLFRKVTGKTMLQWRRENREAQDE